MLAEMRRWDRGALLPDKMMLNIRDAATADYLRRLWESGSPYHPWLGLWRHFAQWEGSFLDIGANMGQSVVSFAMFNPRMAIWAFEPNPLCAESIAFAAGLVPNEVRIFLCGIAADDTAMRLHVPVVRGQGSFGPSSNATLRRTELDKPHVVQRLLAQQTDPAALSVAELPAVVRRLERIGEPEALRLVKIDVEGFERQVLEGIGPALRRHRPVLTVERNNWSEILEWMRRENYGGFDYAFEDGRGWLRPDPPGRSGKVVDAVLLPLERVEAILAEADGLALRPPAGAG
jgi:FkbM family methyltransferase